MSKNLKLSNQAAGALLMCLQKCIAEETDIMPLLRDLNLVEGDGGELVVTNPPTFKVQETKSEFVY